MAEIPGLISQLYEIVDQLESLFPGRSFTPDGHLVGSIGESLAAYMFDLNLMTASNADYDGLAPDQRTVEIKATQRSSVGLSANAAPDHLIVLRLPRDAAVEVVYNGPAAAAWAASGKPAKTSQRHISLSTLRQLPVAAEDRLPVVRHLP